MAESLGADVGEQLLSQEETGTKAEFQETREKNHDGNNSDDEIDMSHGRRMEVVRPNAALETEPVYLAWRERCYQKHPVGWAGSFGFYRMVGRLFFCLSFLTMCFMVHNAVCQDLTAFLMNVLLFIGSVVCGLTSYAHESLSNEVSDMAIENDRFAAMTRSLKKELTVLDPVRERFEELLESTRGDQEKLYYTLRQLSHMTSVDAVTCILDAFLEIDAGMDTVEGGKNLTGEQLVNLMRCIRPVLEIAIPSFNYDDLAREVFVSMEHPQAGLQTTSEEQAQGAALGGSRQGNGLSAGAVKLLIAVCIRGGDEIPGVSMALLGLLLFSMNNDKYIRLCCDALVALFGDEYPTLEEAQEDIDDTLQSIMPDGKNCIYLDENLCAAPGFRELYDRVLQKQPKPEE